MTKIVTLTDSPVLGSATLAFLRASRNDLKALVIEMKELMFACERSQSRQQTPVYKLYFHCKFFAKVLVFFIRCCFSAVSAGLRECLFL